MSEGLNMVTLLGNLGADPELRTGPNGSVCKIRLATTAVWFDKEGNKKENTEWHRVAVFGKRGEALATLLTKGDRICVLGRNSTSTYDKDGQKHYSTEVIATDILFGGNGKARTSTNGGYTRPTAPAVVEDDLPF